jgi:hypothetical protein
MMGTWYVDEYTYYPNFSQHHDELIHAPAMLDQALSLRAHSSLFAARVHGVPALESANIGWQNSPERMRDQFDVYKNAVLSGDESFGFKKIFGEMPEVWRTANGFHVIDSDDPMLVEKGEAYVHKQFTDYFEPIGEPEETSDEWTKLLRSYIFRWLANDSALGIVPPAVVLEPVRQILGFPYEWHGAPIE